MMSLMITYDDGTTTQAVSGQREMAAWEREPFGCASTLAGERTPVLFFRYCAYAALRRLRQLPPNEHGTTPTWEQWDATVEAVDPDNDGPAEAGPTVPDQSQVA